MNAREVTKSISNFKIFLVTIISPCYDMIIIEGGTPLISYEMNETW